MNNLEVLYVYFEDCRQYGKDAIELIITHLSGSTSNHIVSRDKHLVPNVYDYMIPGMWHIIVTTKQEKKHRGRNHWVFTWCQTCTKEEATRVSNSCGRSPSVVDFVQAVNDTFVTRKIAQALQTNAALAQFNTKE